MGARAHDDLAVGVDQRVGLARERRDLDREVAFQPLRRAGADRRQALGDALERRQAEPDLEGGHQQQHDPEHAEGDEQCAVEAARLLVDLGWRRRPTATRKRPSSPRSMVRSTIRSC